MIHVYKNSNVPALNGGLNGWFGRLIRRLCQDAVRLVQNTPIVGMVFHNSLKELEDVVNDSSNFQFRKMPDYEPTPAEAAILEPWATNKLNPFYKKMVEQLSSAFAMTSANVQLVQINEVVKKMCVVKAYFATNETAGYSTDGLAARMELITKIFEPVEKLVADSVAKYAMPLVLEPATYQLQPGERDFFPLIPASSMVFQCNKYVVTANASVKPANPSTPVAPVKPVLPTTPITTPVPVTPTTPVAPVSPSDPILPALPAAGANNGKRNKGLLIAGGLLLLYLVLPDDKKKENNN